MTLIVPNLVMATPEGVEEAAHSVGTPTAISTEVLSPTERATLKTITFQTAANLSDTLVFGALVGASANTSVAFLLANTASAVAVYFPYELAWSTLGPPTSTTETIAIKTALYQAITSVRNLALGYAFSGAWLPSAAFVGAAMVVDSAIYVANEYLWDIYRPIQ